MRSTKRHANRSAWANSSSVNGLARKCVAPAAWKSPSAATSSRDTRCRYCMAEDMRFLPRDALLELDEIGVIAERFIARGVTKIRLTGGEPLVRRGAIDLSRRLGRHVGQGLDELTLTTNGTRLAD